MVAEPPKAYALSGGFAVSDNPPRRLVPPPAASLSLPHDAPAPTATWQPHTGRRNAERVRKAIPMQVQVLSRLRSRAFAFALIGLIATLGFVRLSPQVALADDWCSDDPTISVNGQQTQITVLVHGDSATVAAAGVVAHTVVYLLAGVSTSVIVPPGTTPFLQTLTFVTQGAAYRGSGPVKVKVVTTFTSLAKLGATMQIVYPNGSTASVSGNTNGSLVEVAFQE